MYRKNTTINISNMVTMTNKKLIDSAHAKQSSRFDYEKFIVTVHLCSYGLVTVGSILRKLNYRTGMYPKWKLTLRCYYLPKACRQVPKSLGHLYTIDAYRCERWRFSVAL